MTTALWTRIETLLGQVQKPARYIGCEDGAVIPRHGPGKVSWLLAYPDAYEVGLPNQGLQILYEILNERADAVAERTYAPWTDLAPLLRRHGVPLFSVDTHRAAGEFDLLAFNLSSELVFTNVLEMIDLAGVPVRAADRRPEHPLVVVGGHSAFNPEPLADFVDLVVLGEGEEVVGEITEVVGAWIRGGRADRDAVLRDLAQVPGVYVPSMYDVDLRRPGDRRRHAAVRRRPADGRQADGRRPGGVAVPEAPARPADRGRPRPPQRRGLPRLHPRLPVLPGRDDHPPGARAPGRAGAHDGRRGPAPHGLRRGRPDVAVDGRPERRRATSSAASSPTARPPRRAARRPSTCRRCASTRSRSASPARSPAGRRSGLTFAPEAGSWRLRQVINKLITEDDLYGAVDTAFAEGWSRVKLYFLIGLPTETDEDTLGIAELARNCVELGRRHSSRTSVTASVGGFVPKPHTPFQWFGQNTRAELQRKVDLLRIGHAQGAQRQPQVARPGGDRRRGHPQPRRPSDRAGHRAGVARRRHVPGVGRALRPAALDGRAGGRGPVARLVRPPAPRPQRGAAVDAPHGRPPRGLPVGRLAGRPRRRVAWRTAAGHRATTAACAPGTASSTSWRRTSRRRAAARAPARTWPAAAAVPVVLLERRP